MKKYIFSFALLCSFFNLYGQKNNFYVNAGSMGFVQSVTANYEFRIGKDGSRNKSYLRTSAGVLKGSFYNSDDRVPTIYTGSVQVVILFGKEKKFFETSFGVLYGVYEKALILPALGFGYRYEGEKWIFRTGVHFPEGIYLGGGLRF